MNWDELAAGKGCPFDAPRFEPNEFWESVVQLSVSTLCLLWNQAYRGHCILIYDPKHVVRPDQLSAEEWAAYAHDLHSATKSLVEICRPDHINVVCQGNQIPHLHWHIIPRYRSDPRWGGPITMTTIAEMAHGTLPNAERAKLIADLRSLWNGISEDLPHDLPTQRRRHFPDH